jgi:hypothetical protein
VGRHDREYPFEERRSGSSAGTFLAFSALIAGLAAFVAAFLKFKIRIANDDSPIIIKSGSLSLAVKDNTNVSHTVANRLYRVTSDEIKNATTWTVVVAELEAGFPVNTKTHLNVKSVVLKIVKDDGLQLETVTMTFEDFQGQKVIQVRAAQDNDFDSPNNLKIKRVNKSNKHKTRFVHKKILGDKEFEIGTITVNENAGASTDYEPGHDHALAFQFS